MALSKEDVSKLLHRFEGLVGHQVSRLKTDVHPPTWSDERLAWKDQTSMLYHNQTPACGKQTSVYSNRTQTWSNQAPSLSNDRTPVMSNQRPLWSNWTQPTRHNRTQSFSDKTPFWNCQKPVPNSQKPVRNSQKPVWNSQKPMWNDQTPKWNDQTPVWNTGKGPSGLDSNDEYIQVNSNAQACSEHRSLRGLPCAVRNLRCILQLLATTLLEVMSPPEVLTPERAWQKEKEAEDFLCAVYKKAVVLENQLYQYLNPGLVTSLNRRSAKATCDAEVMGKIINKLRRESRKSACDPAKKVRACEMAIKLKSMLLRQKCEWQCVGRLKETVAIARDMRDIVKFVCQLSSLLNQSLSDVLSSYNRGRSHCNGPRQAGDSSYWNTSHGAGYSDTQSCPSIRMPSPFLGEMALTQCPSELTISLSLDLCPDEADDNDCDRRRKKKADKRSRRRSRSSGFNSPDYSKSDTNMPLGNKGSVDETETDRSRRSASQPPPISRRKDSDSKGSSRHFRKPEISSFANRGTGRSSEASRKSLSKCKRGPNCCCCDCSPKRYRDNRDGSAQSAKKRTAAKKQDGEEKLREKKRKHSSQCVKMDFKRQKSHNESPSARKPAKTKDLVRQIAEESAAKAKERLSKSSLSSPSPRDTRISHKSHSPSQSSRKNGQERRSRQSYVSKAKRTSKDCRSRAGSSRSRRTNSKYSRCSSAKAATMRVLSDIEESESESLAIDSITDDCRRAPPTNRRHSSHPSNYQNVQNSACFDDQLSLSLDDYLTMSLSSSSCDLSYATQVLSESESTSDCHRSNIHLNPEQLICVQDMMTSDPYEASINAAVRSKGSSSRCTVTSCDESRRPLLVSSNETELCFTTDGHGKPEVLSVCMRELGTKHSSSCGCLTCRTGNNNYVRCGRKGLPMEIGIWGSDTTLCMERKMMVCVEDSILPGRVTQGGSGAYRVAVECSRDDELEPGETENSTSCEDRVRSDETGDSSTDGEKSSQGQGQSRSSCGEESSGKDVKFETITGSFRFSRGKDDTATRTSSRSDETGDSSTDGEKSPQGQGQSRNSCGEESSGKDVKFETITGSFRFSRGKDDTATRTSSSESPMRSSRIRSRQSTVEDVDDEDDTNEEELISGEKSLQTYSETISIKSEVKSGQYDDDTMNIKEEISDDDKTQNDRLSTPELSGKSPPGTVEPIKPATPLASIREGEESKAIIVSLQEPSIHSVSVSVVRQDQGSMTQEDPFQSWDIRETVSSPGREMMVEVTPFSQPEVIADEDKTENEDLLHRWRWFVPLLLLNVYFFYLLLCVLLGPECSTCHALLPGAVINVINMATRSVRLVHYSPAPF